MVELVYKFDERECLKSELIEVQIQKIFIHDIWTPTPITLPRSRCTCRVISISMLSASTVCFVNSYREGKLYVVF